MIKQRPIIVVVALVIVALAGVLKIARYAAAADLSDNAALRHVSPFMTDLGWAQAGPASGRAGNMYTWVDFVRVDCPRAVTIAFLGASAEAYDLVRLDHAGDVAFLQGGDVIARPSNLHRQVTSLRSGLARSFGLQPPVALPLLAVAPAPPLMNEACRGPSVESWRDFARNAGLVTIRPTGFTNQ